jgi:hypothetical protein
MSRRTKVNMKSTIDGSITTNGTGAITGSVANSVLTDLIDSAVFIEDGVDTDIRYFEQEDWVAVSVSLTTIAGKWSQSNSGAGSGIGTAGTGVDGTEKALGVLYCETGSTTGGYSNVYTGLASIVFGYGHAVTFRFRCALVTLSDGTDTYTSYIGFGDNVVGAEHTDGAYFKYTHGTNSGKWEAVTSTGASRTATDTTVAPTAGVFQIFSISVDASGTLVTFSIDGTSVTNSTNIPLTSNLFGMVFKIVKSAGTNGRQLLNDWYDLLITRSTAR